MCWKYERREIQRNPYIHVVITKGNRRNSFPNRIRKCPKSSPRQMQYIMEALTLMSIFVRKTFLSSRGKLKSNWNFQADY